VPAISASAPGKVILIGEHAVVYGQPAIAVPVQQVAAKAIVSPAIQAASGSIHIAAPQVNVDANLAEMPDSDPLAAAVRATLSELAIEKPPAFTLRVSSTIPLAAGLGSGAAVSVAIIRAVSAFLGKTLADERVSALAFEVEKLHHGTPSGIDNTVITFAKPVFFIKGQPIQTFRVAQPFTLIIADTGVASPTRVAVGDVRAAWEKDKQHYEDVFAAIGSIATKARAAIESGNNAALGALMDQNHSYLQEIGVSSPELDNLVEAAQQAGAQGAKLSGGGRGGNMIALVDEKSADAVIDALQAMGAKGIITTIVK
jgi:mevalonate kinase